MTTVTEEPAGILEDGTRVNRFTIFNDHLAVTLMDLGVRATSIRLRDVPRNLILDYESLSD